MKQNEFFVVFGSVMNFTIFCAYTYISNGISAILTIIKCKTISTVSKICICDNINFQLYFKYYIFWCILHKINKLFWYDIGTNSCKEYNLYQSSRFLLSVLKAKNGTTFYFDLVIVRQLLSI